MKAPALPVLGLDQFPADSQRAHFYCVERLEDRLVRCPAVSAPHAHNFYLLLYVTRGHGTHSPSPAPRWPCATPGPWCCTGSAACTTSPGGRGGPPPSPAPNSNGRGEVSTFS